jgi:hypothetical protein
MKTLFVILSLLGLPAAGLTATSLREPGFTALWWAEGPPHYLTMKGPAPAPVLCLRSGEIGLAIDTRSLRLLHAGRFALEQTQEAALEAGTSALLALPATDFQISIQYTGTVFTCTGRGPEPKDEFRQPVRFVETGRFFQRVVIAGLQFSSAAGTPLAATGNLEIALWPDRLSFSLELNHTNPRPEMEATLSAAGKQVIASLGKGRKATLPLFARQPESAGVRMETDPALTTAFDPALGCQMVRLPEKPWSNAKGTYFPTEHLDRLDRWPLTLINDTDQEATARLMFVQEKHLPITGFTPMLCDRDGTPSGLPVQISKNWHQRPEQGHLPHEGSWFHGCTVVRLPAKSRRELLFQMAYARYGGVPAASHAQLSLIGWGHNQFWDESAIGSFGESICYEPGRVQRRCFIDDIRPLTTLPVAGGKPWGWAENCGGGDFLMWLDERGTYQSFRATRTDYRAQGPCRTEVNYREETAGGEITAQMEASLTRSDDYLRAFHHLRYNVTQPVKWRRLAFYQLGADFYNDTPARLVAVGDRQGMREEWTPPQTNGAFDRRGVALSGPHPWVSIHGLDRAKLNKGGAAASRGLIIRSWQARLGGKPSTTPYLATYCSEWGKGNFKTTIELVPPPDVTTLQPGDYLNAEVELVVFPADAQSYYGSNGAFRKALTTGADTWRPVHREAAGNALQVKARSGSLLQTFPLMVAVDRAEKVQAEIQGGVGWLPLTFTGLSSHRGYELRVNGEPFNQSLHGNDYWQTDYQPATKTWSQTFNVPRDGGQPLRVEFERRTSQTKQP